MNLIQLRSDKKRKDAFEQIRKIMEANPPITQKQIRDELGFSNQIIGNAYMKIRRDYAIYYRKKP